MGRPSKQEQIVSAARALFVERGYQGTSIELVVQRAGVSKPTVYNHYPTKQAMLDEMLEDLAFVLADMIKQCKDNFDRRDPMAVVCFYRTLVANPEMVAAYRIRIGEAHKLECRALTQFSTLESVIEQWLDTWFDDVAQAHHMQALALRLVLWPYLLGEKGLSDQEIACLLTQEK